MKIIRNIAAVLIALSLFAGWSPGSGQRLAEASENAQHSCDHSACQAQIANLEAELEEARQSCSLVLRIELEMIPGLLGDWAQLDFHSAPSRSAPKRPGASASARTCATARTAKRASWITSSTAGSSSPTSPPISDYPPGISRCPGFFVDIMGFFC